MSANHDVLPGWTLPVIYAAGFIITARIMFMTSDGEDRAEDRFGSFCVGLIWPLALAAVAVWGLVVLPTLGARTRGDRRRRVAAAEQESRVLAFRIAELEAENERLRGEAL
jgi:Na+/proline symporter